MNVYYIRQYYYHYLHQYLVVGGIMHIYLAFHLQRLCVCMNYDLVFVVASNQQVCLVGLDRGDQNCQQSHFL